MKKFYVKILVIFLLIILASCTRNINENFKQILIDNGKKIIKLNVEIADDNYKIEKGLMFRKNLDENTGMLFIFGNESYETFWMKNTLIPLDIIFIGKDLKIVSIENAVPCNQNPCALYKSSKPVKYVLEVNAGFAMKNNIKPGDKIALNQ